MVEKKTKTQELTIDIDLGALLQQSYEHGERHGYSTGRADGIKFIAQTAEFIMKKNEAERPAWWMATLVSCLENKKEGQEIDYGKM